MGAIIELTPTAAPFHAELRSESFYLGTSETTGPGLPARLAEPWTRDRASFGQFTVPSALVPAFRAALGDVSTRKTAQVTPNDTDPWTVNLSNEGALTVSGPAHLYGLSDVGTEAREIHTMEIAYEHLPHLYEAIDQARDRAARGTT
jgi:hypothetical protein